METFLQGCTGKTEFTPRGSIYFQGRYKASFVEKKGYPLELSPYMVLNPVKGGIVALPEEWYWPSYRAIAGSEKGAKFSHTDWILGSFSPSKVQAQRPYISFVREGIGKYRCGYKLKEVGRYFRGTYLPAVALGKSL